MDSPVPVRDCALDDGCVRFHDLTFGFFASAYSGLLVLWTLFVDIHTRLSLHIVVACRALTLLRSRTRRTLYLALLYVYPYIVDTMLEYTLAS